MKFLADHCFFHSGVELLRKSGYEILTAKEAGLARASDKEIIAFCGKENRVLLTLDSDFNSLYRFPLGSHKGIVFFKVNPFKPNTLIEILQPLIKNNTLSLSENALLIVSRNKVKFIRPGSSPENT